MKMPRCEAFTTAPKHWRFNFNCIEDQRILLLHFSSPSFDMGGTNFSDMHVQSASIDVPLSRGNIEALR